MRKWNAVISAAILILFVIHAAAGVFQLSGLYPGGQAVLSALTRIMLTLLVLHAVFGIILTVRTLRTCRESGISYFRGNKLFWARRISGFAVLLLIFFHVMTFLSTGSGAFRLPYFGGGALTIQLLFVAAVAVHVIANVKPILISFGIRNFKEFAADILIILSVILIFAGVAFFLYYLRWNRF